MAKQRVMEDLDALLSDLELTTSPPAPHSRPPGGAQQRGSDGSTERSSSSFKGSVGSNHSPSYRGSAGSAHLHSSRESTPPPPNEQQIYSTTVTVKNHKIGGGSPSHQAHAKTHAHTIPKVHGAESSYSPNMSHHKPGTMSSLSNNLSELDMLLQDLSSAQFMAEVDRRNNAANSSYHNSPLHSGSNVPVINVKNGGSHEGLGVERSVDSLLYELENTVPSEGNVRVVQEGSSHHSPGAGQSRNPAGGHNGAVHGGAVHGGAVHGGVHGGVHGAVPGATSATKELDSLMTSLSDFKVSSRPTPPNSGPPSSVSSNSTAPLNNVQGSMNHHQEPMYAKPHKGPKHVGEPPYAVVEKSQQQSSQSYSPASNHSASSQLSANQYASPQQTPGGATMMPVMTNMMAPAMNNQSQGKVQQHYQYQQQQYSSHSSSVTDQSGETKTSTAQTLNQAHYHGDNSGLVNASSNMSHYESVPMAGGGQATSMSQQFQQMGGDKQHAREQAVAPFPVDNVEASSASQDTTDNLDTMLGNLNTDMSKQGIVTIPKGHCADCAKPIVGPVITALGSIWHPEHFTCAECQEELGVRNFFEREGLPYCEKDYHGLFSPRCAHCNGPIIDKCLTALNQNWHPDHFVCAKCCQPFGEGGYHEKDGKAYCRADYFDLFAPPCGRCNVSIMDNFISALGRQWHPECFSCMECNVTFSGGNFFDHEGMPYCETHYHALRGSLCAGCAQPITGRCITAMFKKFHPEHFVCAFCLRQLNKGTFKEQADKPYCHDCFNKLFGCMDGGYQAMP